MNTDRCTSLSNSSFFFLKEQELILNEEKEIHLLHFASIIHKQSLNGVIICSALKRRQQDYIHWFSEPTKNIHKHL